MNDGSPSHRPRSNDARLPKSARLAESALFVEMLKGRRKAAGAIEMAVRGQPDGAPGAARLAVVVGRKNLRRAVDRNTLKRIVREAFRRQRAGLPPVDVLFRLRQKLGAVPRTTWKAEVEKAVAELLEQARRMKAR